MARRLGYTHKDASQLVASVVDIMTQELQEGRAVALQGFGTFEVKKKLERIVVNPVTGQRMLVPPKLCLNFKPSQALKEMFKNEAADGR